MLNKNLVSKILTHLNYSSLETPSLEHITGLVNTYIRRVPWESASRIVRRANVQSTEECPRWPDMFWQSAITHGTGGTCFESNYAFYHLLLHVGYEGYLTINNMGDSIACHTAIIVQLGDEHYLVDVGLPLAAPLRIDPARPTTTPTEFHIYTLTPVAESTYIISRDNHLKTYCFTLIDQPIEESVYRQATTNDYGDKGLFLDQVIVTRVVEERQWRFKAGGEPYQLESFHQGDKTLYYLGDDVDKVIWKVANKFEIDQDVILQAMRMTDSQICVSR